MAAEAVAWAAGLELDAPRFWRAKRAGATTLQALLALGHEPAVAERAASRWAQRIEAHDWLRRDRALPGVARTLARLRGAGYRIAVLTARRDFVGAGVSLRAAGLEGLIDDVHVVDPAAAAPAKAAILKALGAPPFIGDSESDAEAAMLAGAAFVAVATGQRSRGYLIRRGLPVAGTLTAALRELPAMRLTTPA